MSLLMIEFDVVVVGRSDRGEHRISSINPTYISMDKIQYFYKIEPGFAEDLCRNSGDVNPEEVSNYTIFSFGMEDKVLIAESFDAIVEKLNKANAIFHSRNING